MKQYLLTSDQIERMLACAIEVGIDSKRDTTALESYLAIEANYRQPRKDTHNMACSIFDKIKENEIILPLENN